MTETATDANPAATGAHHAPAPKEPTLRGRDGVWDRVAKVESDLKKRLERRVWKPGAARDPELRKILLRLLACLHEARRMRESRFDAESERRLEELLEGEVETLGLHSAIEVLDGLDQLLIAVADHAFLRNLLELELYRSEKNAAEGLDRFAGPYITWTSYFGACPPPSSDGHGAFRLRPPADPARPDDGDPAAAALASLIERREVVLESPADARRRTWRELLESGHASSDVYEEIRWRLAALRWARSCEFRLHRARQGMRSRALRFLAPVLVVLTGALAAAIAAAADERMAPSILLAGLAGALGGTMAGTFKLRDHVSRIGDLRSLRPALYVQPLLGAAAGLIVLLAVVGGFLPESPQEGWAKYGLLAFGAGFSEPFFLGIVARVASTGRGPSPGVGVEPGRV